LETHVFPILNKVARSQILIVCPRAWYDFVQAGSHAAIWPLSYPQVLTPPDGTAQARPSPGARTSGGPLRVCDRSQEASTIEPKRRGGRRAIRRV